MTTANMGDLHFANFKGAGSPLQAKLALGKLSTDLAHSETLRNMFVADPVSFVHSHYGIEAGASESAYLRSLGQLYADGLCCKGCGCLAADTFKNAVVLPAVEH
jgi:hypothetical protein